MSLILLTGFVLGLLASLPVYILTLRRFTRIKVRELELLKQEHQERFRQMIDRMQHEGPIPLGSSSDGLTGLISWAVLTSITVLEGLLERKEWNTMEAISNLRGVALVELEMLHRKLTEFLDSRRTILKDYNKDQGV